MGAVRTMLRGLCVGLAALFLPTLAHAIDLTPAEQDYLKAHPKITYCVDPDWEPFEIIDGRGQHYGIAADLLNLAATRAGVQLELVKTKDWDESLQASREGRCQMLSFLNQTAKRDQWLLFTDPLFIDSNVFITREDHPFIIDPGSLASETIALPSGTSIEERIRRDYPNLAVIITGSEDQAIALVSEKRAHMTMRSLIMAAYTIRKDGLFNLKVSGQVPGYENRLRIGVLKDQPILRDIFNKAIATITPVERGQIVNQHISVNVETAVDYMLIVKIVGGFLVVLAFIGFWSFKLKRLNRELKRLSQTDSLTGLYNRGKLSSQMALEIERAVRYGRSFSVIMIDFDHFKAINDEFGHMTGDLTLSAFSKIAKQNLRTLDCVGRWGGEEFLILCPETDLENTIMLAERLRVAVRAHHFPSRKRHTISAGVATFVAGDDADSLLLRADSALYDAKKGGRDRVCHL